MSGSLAAATGLVEVVLRTTQLGESMYYRPMSDEQWICSTGIEPCFG